MLGVLIWQFNRPALDCNADIMVEYCDTNGKEMRRVVNETRKLLPDSTLLVLRFDHTDIRTNTDLSDEELKNGIVCALDKIGCKGIEIDNYGKLGFTTFWFRCTIDGEYLFRLYQLFNCRLVLYMRFDDMICCGRENVGLYCRSENN